MSAIGSEVRSALGSTRNHLRVSVASGEALDVRRFTVHQRMSALFQISLVAHAESPSFDFDAVIGQEASFTILTLPEPRRWTGICNHIQQVAAEADGLSTYELSIVPALWFATQRRNYRMFQQISEPDSVLQLLKEWGVEPETRFDKSAYKKRKYRVQYGESDFDFMSRMLEDAGIAFFFEQQGEATKLVLSDAPHQGTLRPNALPFNASPTAQTSRGEHVTAVRFAQAVRPGKYTVRDHDYRLPPAYKLLASASGGHETEGRLESFEYTPGAFLFASEKGESSPVADDRGKTRTDEAEAAILARKRLDAKRGGAKICSFETNTIDLAPGVVTSIEDHPRGGIATGNKLLVIEVSASGTSHGEMSCHCEAWGTDTPYRPQLVTPRPKTQGVESATVVGPAGEEIHTDEFGRVRVHFHWDRESKMDEKSSCWIHVSQSWGGTGYGGTNLPRVGQEVIVDFLGGDPDRPVIMGRMYTNLQKTPYKLPANKTQSGWKSNSTGGGGGFNELMFEDAKGRELVHIQAQKDFTELVKNNQSSTVLANRSASVTQADSTTVGASQSLDVVASRTAVIGDSDATDVGTSHTITVASGTGTTMVDKAITVTTGTATIFISGSDISLNAQGNLWITAGGHLALSGKTVHVDGGPMVRINCGKRATPRVKSIAAAKKPKKPGDPVSIEESSKPAKKLGDPSAVGALQGFNDLPVNKRGTGLDRIANDLPTNPAQAPPMIGLGPVAAKAIQASTGASAKSMLFKDDLTKAMGVYQLAKSESLASLPSTLQFFGPVLPPVPSFGSLNPHAIADLVNVGNTAGIFHVGGTGAAMAQFMALRTKSAPEIVDGERVRDAARGFVETGMTPEGAYAQALQQQGVALYKGDPEGNFARVMS